MKRYFLIRLIILIGSFGLILPAFSQKLSFNNGHRKDVMRFKLVHNLIVIPVFVNDRGPFNFILDSGVKPIIITDSSIVSPLDTVSLFLSRIRGRGIGPELEAFVMTNLSIDVGDASGDKLSGILLKEDPFHLSAYVGIPIHGIIGSDVFNSFMVKLNYLSSKMTLYNPEEKIRKRGDQIPIQLIDEKPYVNVLVSSEDGSKDSLLLLIDSGAGHAFSLDLTDDQKRIHPAKTIEGNLGKGLSGSIYGLVGRLPEIQLGEFSVKKVVVAFPMYEDISVRSIMTERSGSIGGELLKRFHVLFDYSRQEMYLKKNREFRKPYEYDMSGMEVYILTDEENHKRFFISQIDKDTPAEKEGFLAGDEILSINFKDVEGYTLDDINNLLQEETTTDLLFQILRDDQILVKLLELKRRI
ncbi:PDZ domain-containing protein [Albibacterium bauzanense]|uniref:PDZ domain-containing protein n=1 Tax=Albibacterium bauzanense TaxID=653929 RepID=A0A4R1LPG2_9SPHI|nr:PDZ domain-containing protein [Albibacterium bauzanense]TCK80978.1 PDZ domain-containing protein [Albibacterium bauzanense]